MLLEDKTVEEFGYTVDSLSKGSNKKISIKCDYCKKELHTSPKQRNNANVIIDKDACKACRYVKRKEVSLATHGVANSAQRPEVRQKIRENCTFKNEGFIEKRNQTMMERYGTINSMHSAELKKKHKDSVREKYGVDNVSQVPEIRKKVEETNLRKYGNKQFLASDYGKKVKEEGMMKKYGVINSFQSEEIKEKIKQTHLEKTGYTHHLKDKDMAKQVAKKTLETKIKQGDVKLYDGKPISEWLKDSEYSNSAFRANIKKFGFDKAISMTPKMSTLEYQMKNWLDEEGIKYQQQFKVENRYADFYLPDHNIVIEIDGLFWHSDKVIKDKKYHINKSDLYTKHGYRSFFFRENEINDRFNIVKSIVKNSIGKSNRVFARKCEVKTVETKVANAFFEKNHLMGPGKGLTTGLYYEGELVSAIRIKRTKDNHYEISRFCHKLNTSVVGGFSRLLKHFERFTSIETMTTFIDNRYGLGTYLTDMNFQLTSRYASFKWCSPDMRVFGRMSFKGNSGYEKGLAKIWDCGQSKYLKNYAEVYSK